MTVWAFGRLLTKVTGIVKSLHIGDGTGNRHSGCTCRHPGRSHLEDHAASRERRVPGE